MSDFIKEFWESQAVKHQIDHTASWGDNFAIDLEIDTIARHIASGSKVLDVGCANGFATLRQLTDRRPGHIQGIDFAENMIEQALVARQSHPDKDKVAFSVGDIRSIEFANNSFDTVYTTRVLINLPNWKQQLEGIEECLRVTRPGGTVVLSEGFYEPLVLLNAMRTLVGLSPLVEHDFNRYLKKERLAEWLDAQGLAYKCIDFSSVYYLGSRFLRELVTDPSQYPGYSNPINKAFYQLEKDYSGGGFGIQQAYVIKKR
jgi:ubiquinone/menaquinone biosynthesis C-methylase UbiE